MFQFSELLDDFVFDNADKPRNEKLKNIVDAIELRICKTLGADLRVSYHSLYLALIRYSKDVYGLFRVNNILSEHIMDKNKLDDIIYKIKYNGGFMIESLNPHINKRIAYLVYHLMCQKPFYVNKLDNSLYKTNKLYYIVGSHFNEFIILFIVSFILEELNITFGINISNIEYFLHSIRHRNLSRSSLELLFESLLLDNSK